MTSSTGMRVALQMIGGHGEPKPRVGGEIQEDLKRVGRVEQACCGSRRDRKPCLSASSSAGWRLSMSSASAPKVGGARGSIAPPERPRASVVTRFPDIDASPSPGDAEHLGVAIDAVKKQVKEAELETFRGEEPVRPSGRGAPTPRRDGSRGNRSPCQKSTAFVAGIGDREQACSTGNVLNRTEEVDSLILQADGAARAESVAAAPARKLLRARSIRRHYTRLFRPDHPRAARQSAPLTERSGYLMTELCDATHRHCPFCRTQVSVNRSAVATFLPFSTNLPVQRPFTTAASP